ARAHRVLRVRQVDTTSVHLQWNVQIRRRFALVEANVGRQTVLRIIDVALVGSHAEAPDAAAVHGLTEPFRVNDRAALGHASVVDNVELAGVSVQLDLHEGDCHAGRCAGLGQSVLGNANETGSLHSLHGALCGRGDVIRILHAAVLTTQFDGFLCGFPEAHALAVISRQEHALIGNAIVIRHPSELAGSDLLELAHNFQCGNVAGASLGKDSVTATLVGAVGQVPVTVTVLDHAAVPAALQYFRGSTDDSCIGVST